MTSDSNPFPSPLSRRAFLQGGSLILTAGTLSPAALLAPINPLRIGLVTDLHYADKPAAGSRHYRDTPEKLADAAAEFARHDLAFAVELGDFIDAADSVARELEFLKRIQRDFAGVARTRHYVLGNHCVHTLTKQEFLDGVEQPRSYYSFDQGDVHFVVLDACFRSDGQPYGRHNFKWTDANIPPAELEWLEQDLKAARKPTVVFAHQRLDVANHYGVRNAAAVRRLLQASGQVLAVFQGHSHKNDYKLLDGIHYCTLVAMVEGAGRANNGYSVLSIQPDRSIRVSGFRKQNSYKWS